jgi:hypothetical protein
MNEAGDINQTKEIKLALSSRILYNSCGYKQEEFV